MLNKEICKKCINEKSVPVDLENSPTKDFLDALFERGFVASKKSEEKKWNEINDYDWNCGMVRCPLFKNFKILVKSVPPNSCPFQLEHLMDAQKC